MSASEAIAASLRGIRATRDETQRQVAEAVGVACTTLSSWERRGGIGLADAWKLADHYGVSIDELAGRKHG